MVTCRELIERFKAAGTKCYGASYATNYAFHFAPRKEETRTLLEIGVGGYDSPSAGGESLRIWKDFFPNACIYGIDIADKSGIDDDRIRTFRGDQSDPVFLDAVIGEIGSPDIVIDDGSHRNDHVIASFQHLFPKLKATGVYVIEDTQFSHVPSFRNIPERDPAEHPFWSEYGGALDLDTRSTMVNYFKRLADRLNHKDFINPNFRLSQFDETIVGLSFYRGQIFVNKGDNSAPGHLCYRNALRPEWLASMGVESMDDLHLAYPDLEDNDTP